MLLALEPRDVPNAAYHPLASSDLTQNWSNTSLITVDDNWSAVPSIQGFRGDNLTTGIGVDPRTILADGHGTPIDVVANRTNPNITIGGVGEFHLANPVVALQGSATADAPHLVMYLDATGVSGVNVSFTLRDIDGSANNAVQPVAVQYRVGGGAWANVPDGYFADVTAGPGVSGGETPVSLTLPAAVDGQSQVQVRVLTTNAASYDEWVGIDDIHVSAGLALTGVIFDSTYVLSGTTGEGEVRVQVTTAVPLANAPYNWHYTVRNISVGPNDNAAYVTAAAETVFDLLARGGVTVTGVTNPGAWTNGTQAVGNDTSIFFDLDAGQSPTPTPAYVPHGAAVTFGFTTPTSALVPVAATFGNESLGQASGTVIGPSINDNSAISGRVWLDSNANGIQDDGATDGLAGVTVRLQDSMGAVIATVVTDTDGGYSFSSFTTGETYRVQVVNPYPSQQYFTVSSVDDEKDSDVDEEGLTAFFIEGAAGADANKKDAGVVTAASITIKDGQRGVIGDFVRSLKENGTKHFIVPKQEDAFVVLKAKLKAGEDFATLYEWDGGEAIPNGAADERRVSRAATGKTVVQLKKKSDGTVVDTMYVWSIWATIEATNRYPVKLIEGKESKEAGAKDTVAIASGWSFVATIAPVAIFDREAEVPDFKNPFVSDFIPGGDSKHPFTNTKLEKGVAFSRFDVSRQIRVRVLSPNIGTANGLLSVPGYGLDSLPSANIVTVAYPNNSLVGNDDPFTNDEREPVYIDLSESKDKREGIDPYFPNLKAGQLASYDYPISPVVYKTSGANGDSVEIRFQFREFVRVALGTNDDKDAKHWFNISDNFLWRHHGKLKKVDGQWKNDGSVSDTTNDGWE